MTKLGACFQIKMTIVNCKLLQLTSLSEEEIKSSPKAITEPRKEDDLTEQRELILAVKFQTNNVVKCSFKEMKLINEKVTEMKDTK